MGSDFTGQFFWHFKTTYVSQVRDLEIFERMSAWQKKFIDDANYDDIIVCCHCTRDIPGTNFKHIPEVEILVGVYTPTPHFPYYPLQDHYTIKTPNVYVVVLSCSCTEGSILYYIFYLFNFSSKLWNTNMDSTRISLCFIIVYRNTWLGN